MKNVITIYPNQQLFDKTRDIPKDQITGDTYRQIGASMLEILRKRGGIGLSANQVGLPLNMCVVELNDSDPKMMLNPRITKRSDKKVNSREGCLSLPGAVVTVSRHEKVTLEYEDVTGETIVLEAEGLLSCCIQHELDHLSGILMINRVNEFSKNKALKALEQFKKFKRRASK